MKSLIPSLHAAFFSWKMKLASLALVGTVALFCLAAASYPQAERGDGASHMPAVEGSWLLTISPSTCADPRPLLAPIPRASLCRILGTRVESRAQG